jgi:hypothetical protein
MGKSRGRRRKHRASPIASGGGGGAPGAVATAASTKQVPLLKKLDSIDDDEREHGCLAVASIAAESREQLQQLVELGTAQILAARIADHVARVRVAAVMAARSMIEAGGGPVSQALLSCGAVGSLVAQLQWCLGALVPEAAAASGAEPSGVVLALLGHVLVALKQLCHASADAVVALTERTVFDSCVALLDTSAPVEILVEVVSLLQVLVDENPAGACYLAGSERAVGASAGTGAHAPLLRLAALGQAQTAPPLLAALCAGTVLSVVRQSAAPEGHWSAEEAWAMSALLEIVGRDLLTPAVHSLSGGATRAAAALAELQALQPQLRAQLKAMEALTDTLLHDPSGADPAGGGGASSSPDDDGTNGAVGQASMRALLPRSTVHPSAADETAAAALLSTPTPTTPPSHGVGNEAAPGELRYAGAPIHGVGNEAAPAAAAAAAVAAEAAEAPEEAKAGVDAAVVSEAQTSWALLGAIPAHASRCLANLLANSRRLPDAALRDGCGEPNGCLP